MNKYFSVLPTVCAALLCATAPDARAQTAAPAGAGTEAVIPLPYGVDKLIASDAHSSLLAVTTPDETKNIEVREIVVKHVYPGGIARLFGGTIIPAGLLVEPSLGGGNAGFGTTPIGFAGLGANGFGGDGFDATQPGAPQMFRAKRGSPRSPLRQ